MAAQFRHGAAPPAPARPAGRGLCCSGALPDACGRPDNSGACVMGLLACCGHWGRAELSDLGPPLAPTIPHLHAAGPARQRVHTYCTYGPAVAASGRCAWLSKCWSLPVSCIAHIRHQFRAWAGSGGAVVQRSQPGGGCLLASHGVAGCCTASAAAQAEGQHVRLYGRLLCRGARLFTRARGKPFWAWRHLQGPGGSCALESRLEHGWGWHARSRLRLGLQE